jgi:hypothetical protein
MHPAPGPDFRALILAHGHRLKDAIDKLKYAPEHWQTTLLIELAGENLINCFELADPNNGINAGRLGWAARNLLELHYFTRYVIESEKKAKRFREDMLIDYRTMLDRLAKNPAYTEHIKAGQAIIDHLFTHHAERVKPKTPLLSAREIAEQYGEGMHYGDTHKFLSKFAHPTSLSIQIRKANPIVEGVIIPSILETALRLIADTFPRLAGRILEVSVHP